MVNAMKEPDRTVFQLPNFMTEAETSIQVWKRSGEVAQIIFGSRSAAEKVLLCHNQEGYSLKMNIWN